MYICVRVHVHVCTCVHHCVRQEVAPLHCDVFTPIRLFSCHGYICKKGTTLTPCHLESRCTYFLCRRVSGPTIAVLESGHQFTKNNLLSGVAENICTGTCDICHCNKCTCKCETGHAREVSWVTCLNVGSLFISLALVET